MAQILQLMADSVEKLNSPKVMGGPQVTSYTREITSGQEDILVGGQSLKLRV